MVTKALQPPLGGGGAAAWHCLITAKQHLNAMPLALIVLKYYPGPMLLNFSAQMGTNVSNKANGKSRV